MINGLPRRVRSACNLSRAASFTSSLPVPRQAISAGEKFCQRHAAAGTSRQWAWKVIASSRNKKARRVAGRGCRLGERTTCHGLEPRSSGRTRKGQLRGAAGQVISTVKSGSQPEPVIAARVVPRSVAVDGLPGHVADIQPRQANVGKLAVAECVELVVGCQVLAVVGEALAQAGEDPGLLGVVELGVPMDIICHFQCPLRFGLGCWGGGAVVAPPRRRQWP